MKFLHAADVHIDSPLRGLSFDDPAADACVRHATRAALEKVVRIAIEEAVEFVIIAGDLFDGDWPDMRTGLWTAEQFRRLREHDIRVYLIRGNHDAASVVTKSISFPENVVLFESAAPHSVVDPRSGAVLHGQSFAARQTSEDLAKSYPTATPGAFNIGVLHTSLAGDPEHDTYAPTSVEVLKGRGYQYWALGHVHQRRIVATDPYVVFPGNTQGRHIKETGAKGCYVVTVEEQRVVACEFVATDVARWQPLTIALGNSDDDAELWEHLTLACDRAAEDAQGLPVILRLTLTGACRLHGRLGSSAGREALLAEIRNRAADCGSAVWIESVVVATRPAVDRNELRQGGDLLGEVLRTSEWLRGGDTELAEVAAALTPLTNKLGDALDDGLLDLTDPNEVRLLLDAAENLVLAELLGGEA